MKIVFWLTAAASVILLYTGIKGLSLYLNAKKAASEANSGSLDNLFSSGANLLGKGMDFFSTAKTMQGILNLIVIAVIVAAVLIYLKAKKENKIEEKQGRIIGVQRKLKISEIEEKVEAIIFLAKEIVTVQELAQFYAMENFEMEEVLHSLREKRKNNGINLKIENGVVFLVSNPLFGFDVKRFFNPEMKLKKLSRSAMETLAIIAYKGPVTKAEIEQIRGAGADKTMANLLERKLIYISGKKKSIGTPNLYEVTKDFYSYLNIHGREELPGSEQFQKIDLLYREDEKMETESSDNENV